MMIVCPVCGEIVTRRVTSLLYGDCWKCENDDVVFKIISSPIGAEYEEGGE